MEQETNQPKGFWTRNWKWITIVGIIIIIFLVGGYILKITLGKKTGGSVNKNEKIIVSNIVDPSQISSISKFRSCAGHLYGKTDIDGQKVESASLKHYFVPIDSLSPSDNKVKIFAPFDGKVLEFDPHVQRGVGIILVPDDSDWTYEIFHIKVLDNIKTGTKVKAGDLLGYGVMENKGDSFDIALNYGGEVFDNLDSVFNHMSDEVLAQFQKYGITSAMMSTSREERNASPCSCRDGQPGTTECNFFDDPEHMQENYVTLTNK